MKLKRAAAVAAVTAGSSDPGDTAVTSGAADSSEERGSAATRSTVTRYPGAGDVAAGAAVAAARNPMRVAPRPPFRRRRPAPRAARNASGSAAAALRGREP